MPSPLLSAIPRHKLRLVPVSPCHQLEFVRKRYHKDIMSSPVLMLNFCPDLLGDPLDLHKATRELVFLIDRSGSMSGANIRRVKVSRGSTRGGTQRGGQSGPQGLIMVPRSRNARGLSLIYTPA